MQHQRSQAHTILRDLGDGLILRRSTPDDTEALAAFNARIHSNAGPEHPNVGVAAWTHDLLTGNHPSFDVADFTIVEEARTGAIVSSMSLISQTWAYDGIPFGVGRPELVGTDPEYRHRGLVRAQFEVIHQWSTERGERLQAITGIPWYYRQFGYEMAPLLLALVLGDRLEENFRLALTLSGGSYATFADRSALIVIVVALTLLLIVQGLVWVVGVKKHSEGQR